MRFKIYFSLFLSIIAHVVIGQQKNTEEEINSLIARMTLAEKIDQLSGMGVTSNEFGDEVPVFGTGGNSRVGIPELIMGHGITGVRSGRNRSLHATYFSTPIAIGCSWDTELYKRVGIAMAREMRALNQNLNLGPTLNIIRHPLGGRNWECFSEDPFLSSEMIVPFSKAMQENGIISGPKHFVANEQEHNRFDINNLVDERTLREIYLPPFEAAVKDGGALNIMGAYNRLNGTFMCENEYYLTNVLRDEWGFKGFVLSDFAFGTRSTHNSVRAGLNVEMNNRKYFGESLLFAVQNGEVSEERIDQLLYEKLYAMFRVGMFSPEYASYPKEIVHSTEHQQIALDVSRKSPVLLKNETGILPLKKNNKTIAVIGPNAQRFPNYKPYSGEYAYYLQGGGSGRCYYFSESVVSPLAGVQKLAEKGQEILFAQGCRSPYEGDTTDDATLLSDALVQAKKADVVLMVVGLNGFVETEGKDRTQAGLPENQVHLINQVRKVNKNMVLVIIAGSFIDISAFHQDIPAIVFCPYNGEKLGQGLAEILFGQHNPEGKLSFSYPLSVEQYPEGSIDHGPAFSGTGNNNLYQEGVFVGYRYFGTHNVEMLFPFGHGLSYSAFQYNNLALSSENIGENDTLKITFTLSNISKKGGSEIAQLYIRDVQASVDRPVKELKGFKKTYLKKGESREVEFKIHQRDLSFWDSENNRWLAEDGEFEVFIGASSQDNRLKGSFNYHKNSK